MEKILLKELGFELYRITDHPHKLMHSYLKLLKANNEVARKSWKYLNDSYRTNVCIHYPSSKIAASCIYLAMRVLSVPGPKVAWWVLMETSLGHIEEICSELLNVYELKKINMIDIKGILDTCWKNNKENKTLSLEYEGWDENNEKIEGNSNIFINKESNGETNVAQNKNEVQENLLKENKEKGKEKYSRSPDKDYYRDHSKKNHRKKHKKKHKSRRSKSRSKSRSRSGSFKSRSKSRSYSSDSRSSYSRNKHKKNKKYRDYSRDRDREKRKSKYSQERLEKIY